MWCPVVPEVPVSLLTILMACHPKPVVPAPAAPADEGVRIFHHSELEVTQRVGPADGRSTAGPCADDHRRHVRGVRPVPGDDRRASEHPGRQEPIGGAV